MLPVGLPATAGRAQPRGCRRFRKCSHVEPYEKRIPRKISGGEEATPSALGARCDPPRCRWSRADDRLTDGRESLKDRSSITCRRELPAPSNSDSVA